jgi:molybdate transport system substrate-binding protein
MFKYFFSLLFACIVVQVHAADIHIAAATNLRYVLPDLAEKFEQQTGHQLAVSYAASGTLATQIQHGAPFEVFLSANPDYIQRLIKAQLTEGEVAHYAQAQLALFASNHSLLEVDDSLQSLKTALEQGNLNKVAIANPKHAPYGHIARSELERAGIWQQIQPHLLIAENASQVVQFALSSSVDAGFVPYAHIIQPQLASQGRFVKLDVTLPQQAVLVRGASEYADQLLKFIQTERARTIFIKHGFLVD